MVDDNKWLNAIQDAKLLDQQAENEDYVCVMTDALVLSLNQMYTDAANDELKERDRKDVLDLVEKLGNYSIGGYTIKWKPEYQELNDILQEVLNAKS